MQVILAVHELFTHCRKPSPGFMISRILGIKLATWSKVLRDWVSSTEDTVICVNILKTDLSGYICKYTWINGNYTCLDICRPTALKFIISNWQ